MPNIGSVNRLLTVSLCVIAWNEQNVLGSLFEDIKKQSYPHSLMEVVLVDSGSSDSTKQVMQEFAQENNGFSRVLVLDNPKRIQAAGWNCAIGAALGDVIVRIDAHASIPPEFIENNVRHLEDGEMISGGRRPNIMEDPTPWKETLLLAESSMFGSSVAPYRRGTEKTYVKSMFHAAYRREVFEIVGGMNEALGRTEDNELHYRMRLAGYRFCLNDDVISHQHVRSTLSKMLKQKYSNGYWIGLTAGVCPGCLSAYHFVPFLFLLGILFTTVLAFLGCPLLCWLMWGAYWLLAVAMAVVSVKGKGWRSLHLLLPFLFFLLHVSYGAGTLAGLCKMPFWRRRVKPGWAKETETVRLRVLENSKNRSFTGKGEMSGQSHAE